MEKTKIKIAILQMSSTIADVEENIKKVRNIVTEQLPKDADVLVLPEVWTVGWACSHFQRCAQELNNGHVFEFLSSLAKDFNINIIGGSYITKSGENYFNTCPVFNNNGKLIVSYSKMHLYSYYGCDEGEYITEGSNPVIVELCGAKFGLSICYDIRFPEIYRSYAKAGADILVNCAAWGINKPIQWEMMTKSRAIENQCYMIAVDQCGQIKDGEYNLGHSRIIDYNGNELAYIGEDEKIACAELDIPKMHAIREKSPTMQDIKSNYEVKILCKN